MSLFGAHTWRSSEGYTMRVAGKNKKGGEGGGSSVKGSGGGVDGFDDLPSVPETNGPFQPQATSLPPSRPAGL